MTTYQASDFLNADGSFNTAVIMKLAHIKARAEINLAICVYAELPKWRTRDCALWNAQDAATAATVAPALVAEFKARASFPKYADVLARELKDIWFRARVTRDRWIEDTARREAAELAARPVLALAA
jgi:hypothetical protein